MKSAFVFVLLVGLIALAQAFPGVARDSDESGEIEAGKRKHGVMILLPPARRNIFDEFGDEDDDDDDDEPAMPGMWNPWNPFPDFFAKMQETLKRVKAEMEAALNSHSMQGGLTPWGKIPEGANTTSTTKIIGDHSVTINETTYSDGDENGGTIFRVRVVDVKPLNDTTANRGPTAGNNESSSEEDRETATPTKRLPTTNDSENDSNRREELTTPATRSVETVEDFDNEIYNKNNVKNQVETLNA